MAEVGRALRELDVQLLSHLPGNAQAKGKIERLLRFLQELLVKHNRASSLEELQAQVDRWAEAYNARSVWRPAWRVPWRAVRTISSV